MTGTEGLDSITGLVDGAQFSALAQQEARRAIRYRHPLTLIALALDGLSGLESDARRETAMRTAAALMDNAVREHDLLAHLGGGAFALALIETGEAGAEVVIRRLTETVRAADLLRDGSAGRLALRAAVTACRPEEEPADLALERAFAMLRGDEPPIPVDHHIEEE
jgi:diguanylate cyclase (GGDEF)-like protein